jgi:hypothetical protein
VLLAMLVLPAVVYVSPWVVAGWTLRPGRVVFGHWTGDLTWGCVLGAAGFALAWWLAAARRSWWPALCVAAVAGVLLPVFRWVPVVPPLDLAVVERNLKRHPREEADRTLTESARELGAIFTHAVRIEGQLRAEGLKDDEFIGFHRLIDSNPSLQVARGYRSGQGAGLGSDGGVLKPHGAGLASGHQALFAHLESRLPGRPEVTWERHEQRGENWVSPSTVEQLDAMTWQVRGALYQIRSAGDFPVSRPGSYPMTGEGVVQVWDMKPDPYGVGLGFRTIWPDEPRFPEYAFAGMSWAYLVDEPGKKAALVRLSNVGNRRALGSAWRDWSVALHHPGWPEGWTREEVLRSRLHLFTARPVGRVEATLPPP